MSESLLPAPLDAPGSSESVAETRVERIFPFVRTLREYDLANLRPDFIAGLTTALFTIPQGMAYALIAGFPPAAGLATAVAASILGAAFGSSEFLINGPTNALSVMLAGRSIVGSSSIRDLFKVPEVQRSPADLDLCFPFPAILDSRNTLAAAGVVLVFPAISPVFSRGRQPKIRWVVV